MGYELGCNGKLSRASKLLYLENLGFNGKKQTPEVKYLPNYHLHYDYHLLLNRELLTQRHQKIRNQIQKLG